ncbi:MAG: hypothetical protein AB7F19_00545 [Candidatus Babeliales bacterium]
MYKRTTAVVLFFNVHTHLFCMQRDCNASIEPAQKRLILRIPWEAAKKCQQTVAPMAPFVKASNVFQPIYRLPEPPPVLVMPELSPQDELTNAAASSNGIGLPLVRSSFDKELDALGLDDPKLDALLAEWHAQISNQPLYLVCFEPKLHRHLAFIDYSRAALIAKYLSYVVDNATSQEYATLRAKSETVVNEHIVQNGNEYSINCPHCNHVELQLSVTQLRVKIVLHQLIEHAQDSDYYQQIEKRIAASFEEALAKLQALK